MLPYRHPERVGRVPALAQRVTTNKARSWQALAAALIAAGALAAPASADVRAGNTITAFPDRDMIVAEGDYDGTVTVELRRNDILIGRASGPAQALHAGTGLEVNHGPEGAVGPGDCWNNVTPDVRGGDEVTVIDDRGQDVMTVGGVTLDPAGPQEQLDGSILLTGSVVGADGAALPLGSVTAEVRHKNPVFRANGVVAATTGGGVSVSYAAPYRASKGGNLSEAEQKQAILAGDHMLIDSPDPSEVTIAELGARGGPAPGCESAPLSADAVTSSDDAYVNLTSAELNLGGTARAGTTAVEGVVTDSQGAEAAFTATLSDGDGSKTWTATIARADLELLADGPLAASATYTSLEGTLTGAPLKLIKDTIAPAAPTSAPTPGTYGSSQSILLEHGDADAGTRIHYTTNDTDPTAASQRATGQIEVTSSQTIKAISIDSAGNQSTIASLAYVIEPPAPAIVTVPVPVEVPGPPVATPPTVIAASAHKVSALRVTSSRSARQIARRGLTVAFRAPDKVTKVRVLVLKGKTTVAVRTVRIATPGTQRVRLSAGALRRLVPGRYTLEATPVSTDSVKASRLKLRIVR